VAPTPPDVSVVVPLYNEEENVGPLCAAIREALAGWDRAYEVVLVDDGSTDRTRERLREAHAADGRVRVLLMRRNGGQTAAMSLGFAASAGRIIVSMDGDLQNDPRDIPLLVARMESGFDVVCGWRRDRQDKLVSRKLPSRVANRMIAWITGVPVHDNGCSLKAYRADVIRTLRLYSDMHRFLPALASMTGARIDEVVVRHHARARGQSKYGISRTFKVLADMITIKMVTQFASRPGLWFGLLSLPWLLLGGATLVVWLTRVDEAAAPTIVLPSLSMMFFYLSGFLLSLSLLSEMILARADRRYLHRLVEVLAVETPSAPRQPQGAAP
jgi:glycosyltransferase involved in cell wall biosynthesis